MMDVEDGGGCIKGEDETDNESTYPLDILTLVFFMV